MSAGQAVRKKTVDVRRAKQRKNTVRLLTPYILTVVLVILGFFYVLKYQEYMDYKRYPLKYRDMLIQTAAEFELEPEFVAAIIRCESGFYYNAESNVGARGLMQIMPETGEWLAGKFNEAHKYDPDVLYKPATNMKYGCWYLSWLMRRYDGDKATVIAAYHAGQGKIDSWLEKRSISEDGKKLNIDKIPFKETKRYVKDVLNSYEKYQKLYDFTPEGEEA